MKSPLPKEVYPLLVLIGSACFGSAAFTLKSAFKPDVYLNKEKRSALFK